MTAPRCDEAPALAGAQGSKDRDNGHHNSASASPSAHAQRVIGGERRAAEFLARLQAQQAEPDELALIVAAMYGAMLRGFCDAITKALRIGGAA